MYKDFARIYDRLMSDYNYEKWANFVTSMLNRYGIFGGEGLDLACGSGEFAIRLSKSGFKMSGVDLSNEMLNIARDKARAERVEIEFINQDIRSLKTAHKVDFALIMCDGTNYLTEGLINAFKNINRALRDGGMLIFDISSEYKLVNTIGNNIFFHDSDSLSYIWNNEHDDYNKLIYMDLTFFERLPEYKEPIYRKFSEEHTMKIYSDKDILSALEVSGFKLCEITGNMAKLKSDSARIHFAAKKEKAV